MTPPARDPLPQAPTTIEADDRPVRTGRRSQNRPRWLPFEPGAAQPRPRYLAFSDSDSLARFLLHRGSTAS